MKRERERPRGRSGGRELGMITNSKFLYGDEGEGESERERERERERLKEMKSKYYYRGFSHVDDYREKESGRELCGLFRQM